MASLPALSADEQLAEQISDFYADPLGFVLFAYPWGEPGPLEKYDGPDKWQRDFLEEWGRQIKERKFDGEVPVMPIRMGASSGHGPGKTTMTAWIVDFIMSTRPHCRGTVTANKWDQLRDKTWAAVKKWTALCITSHWFEINDSRMYQKDNRDTWFCAPANSKKENSEAFAGQHAADSTSFYIFDEDSGIEDVIHEVAEGGLTDGEPMIFVFGNPTRSYGHFHKVCFGALRNLWHTFKIDARESKFTNKALIGQWIETYGEDSDFVRVRVKGQAPKASELQFIGLDRVEGAQQRALPITFGDEPLVCGVDVSDGGSAWNVVRFRRGFDSRTIPPVRVPGEKVRNDRSMFLAKLADVLQQTYDGRKVHAMFFDSAFGAPYVERLQAMGFKNVHEVRFGGDSPDVHQLNMRAYMWNRMKEWLSHGCIDKRDERLETDITGPGFHINKQDKLVIESKEDMKARGVDSPDDADALALTFAANVNKPRVVKPSAPDKPWGWG